ncbi:PREDICTED: proclotting enzyme-like [Nicrophorus vespilloides]|uniref:Proclotting enzyme-like n=1 Tax=Nicrophorus vespilloides TaxID=110193 RepID=A0ABM1NGX1_NICVS|nr:PREDICTED: proclotting enzyme-like [Nicrophorus vespilloides]
MDGFLRSLIFSLLVASVLCIWHDDAITIEAATPNRNPKQIFVRTPVVAAYQPLLFNQFPVSAQVTAGPCFTSKAVLGRCMSFRDCYPYFKLPELSNWDAWILGMYDTCSFYTEQGRQMFGVCCVNPQTAKPAEETEPPETTEEENSINPNAEGGKRPNYNEISNWPPPVPTHPPNHTIPPLPTHPPSPGFPGIIPTTESGFSQSWPAKPKPPRPTSKPSMKPSSKPTYKPPTTTQPFDASCGTKNGYQDQERIVGGHNADIGEWPWIAALFNGGRQFCGGSLIDDIHILSAAHCVAHMSSWDVARLTVRLGDHNIKTNSEVRHIEKKVKRVVRHRGFDPRTLYNDIAILTLDSPVQFSKQVRPICLPTYGSKYEGQTATVIGWGSLRESGPQPAVLQEVNIPIWTNSECRQKYGPAAPGGIVDHMICAGQASRDSCSGDSGGPLMVNDGKWTQVGVVSWGIGCGKGQYPGVYTRVEKFLPWINKNLK